MTIQAQLADGRILEFPDGTDQTVIQATVKKVLGVSEQLAQQPIDTGLEQLGQGQTPLPSQGQDISTIGGRPVTPVDPKQVLGAAEAAATIATGAIAEPVAGLAGIAGGILPGKPGQAERAVEATREALTFKPTTREGLKALETVGGIVEPIGKAFQGLEKVLGDTAFKLTGSPALSAAAATIPTAIIEALGAGAGKKVFKLNRSIKAARSKGRIAREISEAVPTIEQLKDTTRAIYKEIDETGALVKQEAFEGLSRKIDIEAKKAGLDPDITPKANKAVQRFKELEGQTVTVTELDTLRKVAQNAAKATEKADAALGVKIIDTVDNFLDKAGTTAIKAPKGSKIGKKYKAARQLWGRARKSELLQDAFEKARNQATGFENGIRAQFRSILNSKKQRRFFNKSEIEAMNRVVRGTKKENIAKLIGKFGIMEGGSSRALLPLLGIAGGGAAFGTAGGVAVPLIGQISRKLAQRMTKANAEFADQVIRAGKDAKKITAAYFKNTPKAARTAEELSELLMRPDIDVNLLTDPFARQAKDIVLERRGQLSGIVTAPELIREENE